eukprot:6227965-Prymnesium_polylepis.1
MIFTKSRAPGRAVEMNRTATKHNGRPRAHSVSLHRQHTRKQSNIMHMYILAGVISVTSRTRLRAPSSASNSHDLVLRIRFVPKRCDSPT